MKPATTNGSNGPAFPPEPLPDLGTIREAADFLAARDAAGKDSPPSCDLEDFNGLPTTPPGLAFRLESFSGPMLDGEHVRFGVEIETRTECAHAELPDGTLVTLPPGTRVRIYGASEAR